MANTNPFPAAAGYGNLPNGNYSPQIFSQKVIKYFKTLSIADEVTNTDFEGELSAFGSSVRILKQPVVSVQTYNRGTILSTQDLVDTDITLQIDQGYAYQFRMDDIEMAHEHVSFEDMAAESAAYQLKNKYDTNVLNYMRDQATTFTGGGTDGSTINIGYNASDSFTPMDLINRLARNLDVNEVPDDGQRFIVAPPQFYEWLAKEDAKLIEVLVTGDKESVIRNRKLGTSRPLHGFQLFKTNNAPIGASSSSMSVIAGHKSALSTAKSIVNSERLRDQTSFGNLYRGLLVFGRKAIRTEGLFISYITLD